MAIDYRKILPDNSSYQLLRTNPKLTGNVKVTVDSDGEVWLNSIPANDELAKNVYQKFPVDIRREHGINIYKFFNKGLTPTNIIYDLQKNVKEMEISEKYEDQYDFSQYYSGVKYLPSKFYDDRFSYFAPLYLKEDIPDYFIIFKVPGAMNYSAQESLDNFPFDNAQYFYDLFKDAVVNSVYDLTDNSKIGQYLRSMLSHNRFPKSPVDINFQKDSYSQYNGVSITAGTYASKYEDLHSFFLQDNAIKFFDQYITGGFERNGILYPNIINLEFLFDEPWEENYEFNRYFGIYVNKIQLSELNIDLDRLEKKNVDLGNSPQIVIDLDDTVDTSLDIENDDGVIIPIESTSTDVDTETSPDTNPYSDFTFTKEKPFFSYVEDKDGQLYLPNLEDSFDIVDGKLDTIRISNKKVDIGKFFGPKDIFLQKDGNALFQVGRSFIEIKILDTPNDFDTIRIYHSRGTRVDDSGNKYDEFVAMVSNEVVPDPGDYYVFHQAIDTNQSPDELVGDLFYYNREKGNDFENAEALANLINETKNTYLSAFVSGDTVVVKLKVDGEHDSKYWVELHSFQDDYTKFMVNDITGDDLGGASVPFRGGSNGLNRLILDSAYQDIIESNQDDIVVKIEDGWANISTVSKYADIVTPTNFSTKASSAQYLAEYNDEIVLTLVGDDVAPEVKDDNFLIKKKYYPKFGLMSMYPIKDLDYDFYSDTYTKFPIWELYKYFYIPPGKTILQEGFLYKVLGTGVIDYDGTQYTADDTFEVVDPSVDFYTQVSGSAYLVYEDSTSDYDLPRLDASGDIDSFEGFFGFRDLYKEPVVDNELYQLRDRFLNGLLNTEYHYYRENYTQDFAYSSKLVPFITKWGYVDGKDSRDNDYRLNLSTAFGLNNLSPDQNRKIPDASRMTNEWYYLLSNGVCLDDDSILAQNYTYFTNNIDVDEILNDDDAFLQYFIYTPQNMSGEYLNRQQYRYSVIRYNTETQLNETFFRGVKLRFKEIANLDESGPDGKPLYKSASKKYDGYKFSVILRPIEEDINSDEYPPVNYRFIEKEDFKFIVLIIDVVIASRNVLDAPFGSFNIDESNIYDDADGSPGTDLKNYDRVNGDYRLDFQGDVSDLSYVFLYSVNNKKYSNLEGRFSNIHLSGKFDFSDYTLKNNSYFVELFEDGNHPNYDYNVLEEITDTQGRNYISMHLSKYDRDFFVSDSGLVESPLSNLGQRRLLFDDPTIFFVNDDRVVNYSIPSQTTAFYQNAVFKQIAGGRNYYNNLFSKLSMAQIKDYVNGYDPIIEYYTYDTDNNQLDNKFYVEVVDPTSLEKDNMIVSVVDDNIPSQFKSSDLVGYKFTRVQLQGGYELNRYRGGYEAITRDVFAFEPNLTLDESFGATEIPFANIVINSGLSDFGVIKNFWNLKVTDKKILVLQNDSEFNPVFEYIDEVAVDKNDFNIFVSSWEYGFHKKYLSKNSYQDVHGFLRIAEDFTFLSKLLNTPSEISVEYFTSTKVDDLDAIDIDQYEIVYKEDTNQYVGIINLSTILVRYFKDNGVSNAFISYLDENYLLDLTIDEYIDAYLRENILPLYAADQINYYIKRVPSDPSLFEFVNLTTDQALRQGYILDENVSINRQSSLLYTFVINKDVNSGFSISPEIKINFI